MDKSYRYKYKPCTISAYNRDKNISAKELSLIAVNENSQKIAAIGSECEEIINGNYEDIKAYSPFKDGIVADFTECQYFFSYIINKVYKSGMFSARSKIALCVPMQITEVEEKAFYEALILAKAKEVYITDEPMDKVIADTDNKFNIVIGIEL